MAIALDTTAHPTGAPVKATEQNPVTSTNTITTASFSTGGGNRFLLAALYADCGAAPFPATLSGGGLTWTLRVSGGIDNASFPNFTGAAIYSAFATSTLTTQTVTATFANAATGPSARTAGLYVWALTGTPTSEAACIGNSAGSIDDSGTSDVVHGTVNVSTVGSWLFGLFAQANGGSTTLTADASTTADVNFQSAGGDSWILCRYKNNPTTGTGNQTFGSSVSSPFPYLSAIEILPGASLTPTPDCSTTSGGRFPARALAAAAMCAVFAPTLTPTQAAIVPTDPVPPCLPERQARPAWNPERSSTVVAPNQTTVTVPTWFEGVQPERARLPWEPERSWTATPLGPSSQVVIPGTTADVGFKGPELFTRPAWNPERSATSTPLGIVAPPVAPTQPPGSCLPERARLPWNPERSGTFSPPNVSTLFPLSVHFSKRYFVDVNGNPFRIQGDAAWDAPFNLSLTDQRAYLDNLKAKGINALVCYTLSSTAYFMGSSAPWLLGLGGSGAGAAALPFLKNTSGTAWNGDPTFVNHDADFSTPNDPYFEWIGQFIDEAANRGMVAMLFPMYLGFSNGSGDGWALTLENATNTTTVCTNFGTYLANGNGVFKGFKNRKNIIWVMGGDTLPSNGGSAGLRSKALIQGIQAAGDTHIVTAHWQSNFLTRDQTDMSALMTAQAAYTHGNYPTAGPTYAETRALFSATPTLPVFLIETSYWGNYGATEAQNRYFMWAAALSSVGGTTMGMGPLWGFAVSADGTTSTSITTTTSWQASFDYSTANKPWGLNTYVSSSGNWYRLTASPGTSGTTKPSGTTTFNDNGITWTYVASASSILNLLNETPQLHHQQMGIFLNSVAWQNLLPSALGGNKTLVTSGGGTFATWSDGNGAVGGMDWVVSSSNPDGSLLLAYVPDAHSGTVTVDMSAMGGSTRSRWLDPTNGSFTADATGLSNTGTHAFTLPGANAGGQNDWLLVLDAAGNTIGDSTFKGPDFFGRPVWRPEYSATVTPILPNSAVVPVDPILPVLVPRPIPAWNPERSSVATAPFQPAAVPVLWGFEGPDFPRYPWAPERTAVATPVGPASQVVVQGAAAAAGFEGPDLGRAAWAPERSWTVTPVVTAAAAAPTLWGFDGPERATQPWNPERSSTAAPAQTIANPSAPSLWGFEGPDAFTRPPWNPERSSTVTVIGPASILVVVARDPVPPILLDRAPPPPFVDRSAVSAILFVPTPPAPTLWGFEGPGRPRFPWAPERTVTVFPVGPSSQLVVVPASPVPPSLPESFTRYPWNPERTVIVRHVLWTEVFLGAAASKITARVHPINLEPGMANALVYLGDDLDVNFQAKDADGNPVDLTGATFSCDVERAYSASASPVAAATFIIDNATAGLCRARFTSAQTAALVAGAEYVYDGVAVLASGLRHTLGSGSFRAVVRVTPTP